MEFKTNAKNHISYYTSTRLGAPNAFLTRCGGISENYGMNLAFGRGDSEETVIGNLRLVSDELGFDAERVISCPQVHSADVIRVGSEDAGKGYFRKCAPADGYVTDTPGVVLGVKTADCTPILLSAKREGKVIAVGALHAGWRGTVSLIAKNAVAEFSKLGVRPNEIFACIGPAAGDCCYEVGEDVLLAARETLGCTADKYIKENFSGKLMADIKGINAYILSSCGVPYENIEISDSCTICEGRYFYSHRRDGERRGTHLNLIWF